MVYTRKLTPDQHRDLRKRAQSGVKLRRLAVEFGLGNASSAFKYKHTVPIGGDWPQVQVGTIMEGDQHANSLDMQGAQSHIQSNNDPIDTSDSIQS